MVPEEFLGNLLAKAAITINGNRAWDVQVRDPRAYARILREGTIGFGEAFMAGWLDCERVDQMVDRAYRAELTKKIEVLGDNASDQDHANSVRFSLTLV